MQTELASSTSPISQATGASGSELQQQLQTSCMPQQAPNPMQAVPECSGCLCQTATTCSSWTACGIWAVCGAVTASRVSTRNSPAFLRTDSSTAKTTISSRSTAQLPHSFLGLQLCIWNGFHNFISYGNLDIRNRKLIRIGLEINWELEIISNSYCVLR